MRKRPSAQLLFILVALVFAHLGSCDLKTPRTFRPANILIQEQVEQAIDDTPKVALRAQFSDEQIQGEIIFTRVQNQRDEKAEVEMILNVSGLAHPGFYAIHIHEFPLCEGDFSSAGDHFNPNEGVHGHPNDPNSHLGDLGNFRADSSSSIVAVKAFPRLSLDPQDSAFIGNRSVIIHAGVDDYTTQPAGDAGERIACAVIGQYNL